MGQTDSLDGGSRQLDKQKDDFESKRIDARHPLWHWGGPSIYLVIPPTMAYSME